MANIFKQQKDLNNHPKRNNFDLSFQNHLTMKMGTLYPVFCKEVVPGDSFRINSAFGLKFMPLAFPVQSKMRATMHFFYVRNKNLWNKWENWIQNLEGSAEGVVHPYISQGSDFFKIGGLADYLNVPTSLAVAGSANLYLNCYRQQACLYNSDSDVSSASTFYTLADNSGDNSAGVNCASFFPMGSGLSQEYGSWAYFQESLYSCDYLTALYGWYSRIIDGNNPAFISVYGDITAVNRLSLTLWTRPAGVTDQTEWSKRSFKTLTVNTEYTVINTSSVTSFQLNFPDTFVSEWNTFTGQGLECAFGISFLSSDILPSKSGSNCTVLALAPQVVFPVNHTSILDNDYVTPFSSTSDAIHISALPFRAYESIYHAYYRNTVNQPFMVNGHEVFNQYNTTVEGGADSTDYHLFQRNYELDFLTSCLPSPQQGNAPLVGMSALGTITLESEDGITTAKAIVDEDSGEITGVNVTSPIASREHAITLAQIAEAGMSINDFRNTNALQRWLETNMRKGYRYLDFIAGHHGVTPKYNELDMPEFIGGFSRDVTVSQIVSSSDTLFDNHGEKSGASLGSYVGMANCFGGSKHSISHFCDDYGFIVGILCVVPTPAYSQLLPKHYLKSSPLDYYFNEFSELGMQPITYEEVCPVQAYYDYQHDNTKKLTDTFGYQRPNYDLVSNVDEIHGQFRDTLSNFLINRVFGSRPVLGSDFLQIDSDEANQIFIDQAPASDNIIGQVIFDVKAKRPVPRVVIPGLGR